MPHRVATFLRSHTYSFDFTTPDKKKKNTAGANSLDLSLSKSIAREGTVSSASSISSTSSMPDARYKRRSLAGANSPRTSSKSLNQHPPSHLGLEIESPPLVFYGTTAQSSGALLSGQLKLFITEEKLDIESFQGRLVLDVKMKKPFHPHCNECAQQTVELTTWKFLQAPGPLSQGTFWKAPHTF
jgi:arrestin-related trafficking adapter 1